MANDTRVLCYACMMVYADEGYKPTLNGWQDTTEQCEICHAKGLEYVIHEPDKKKKPLT